MLIHLSRCLFKIALVLSCVFIIGTSSTFAQKFGHLNSSELLSETSSWKSAEQQIASLQKSLETQYNTKLETYQTEIGTLQQRVQTGNITQAELDSEQNRIMQLEKNIAEFEIDAQQQALQQEQQLLTPLLEKAKAAIEQVAQENGYTYIFDTSVSSAIIYAVESDDVLSLVKAKFN